MTTAYTQVQGLEMLALSVLVLKVFNIMKIVNKRDKVASAVVANMTTTAYK